MTSADFGPRTERLPAPGRPRTGAALLLTWAAAGGGIVSGGRLTATGLHQLGHTSQVGRRFTLASRAAAAAGGVAAVVAAEQAGIWWLLPALLIWANVLVAAASADASTQRVPTPLVRQGAAATVLLLAAGSAISDDWRGLAAAVFAALAAGLILGACWRFAGAGFGDVRLAVLGGLGLGHVTHRGLVIGIAAFALITLTQAGLTLARGGTRRTLVPYGPALAAGFLLAAAA